VAGVSVGDVIAGCRIESVAGRGGMGVVFQATQLRLDRKVAVKAIAPDLALADDYRERFQREARLAASIEHPNVIPVYEADELDTGELYLVMRWVDGTDLGKMLSTERRLSPAYAVQTLTPVALALDAAHARGLVHRDVKPANVLIASGSEHVYLTDFGIARRPDEDGGLTKTGAIVGTLAYAAPERIRGERGGASSDIYALGCVLYELLTGQPPFDRESELMAMHAHLIDPIPSVRTAEPGVPAKLDEVVRVALAKDPSERYSGAGEMARAMQESVSDIAAVPRTGARGGTGRSPELGTTVMMAKPDLTVAQKVRRHRAPLYAAGALALGGAVALVIALIAGGGGAVSSSGAANVASPAEAVGQSTVDVATDAASSGTPPRITQFGELPQSPGPVVALGQDAAVTVPASGHVVIMYANGRPNANVRVGPSPSALATDPTGRLWVVDAASDDVRVLDPKTLKSSPPIRVGRTPSAIAIGGGDAWVADRGANDVRPIDLRTTRPSGPPIPTRGKAPIAIAYGSDGTVWVANRDSSDVTAVRNHRAGVPQPVAGGPIAIAAGAGDAWVGTQSGNVVHLGRSGRVVGQQLAFHSGAAMIALVGDMLWVATRDDGSLTELPVSEATSGSPTPRSRVSLSPAENPIALSCAQHICVASDATTRRVVAAHF
jgi:YVTN family beta-propeller protein